jgi:outer membrane protein OmpA-like peptidoglycan-associated protein
MTAVFYAAALAAVLLAAACGPRRVATAPANPDLVVLLPDDNGVVGRASVSNQLGVVELSGERASTTIVPGKAPTPVVTMDEKDVNAIFGDVLASAPLAPQSFVLYFRFESNELTDESRALLPEVLKAVAARPAPEVVAVGHTDTTGDPKSNESLGLARANRVRDMLVGSGLDAALVEVSSHGEGDLLIQTPDETPEPRNRRVEIAVR